MTVHLPSSRNVAENSLLDGVDCDTSISRCESERGTHGRGTPPTRDKGQPRLDELFRKIQVFFVS